MAVVGSLQDLSHLFVKTEELRALEQEILQCFEAQRYQQIQDLEVGTNFEIPLQYGMKIIAHCYKLKEARDGFFESHYKYIDFQVVISGFERYLIGSKSRFSLLTPYDEIKDLEVHTPPDKPLQEFVLQERDMCVLFPYDVHGVGIGKGDEINQIVRKIIIKVPAELIKLKL